ncbi:MAG: hypothetical protein UU73_C0002G0162 [Candidatus Daviesbacteria bacterium GW2011_GWA1_41_61]|uniref:Ribbon-helix-helix protein CopG domain-containing protein n=1 Tax=Candidatus Daviesbacteria bacterium GW2011_GWA2_40_9 TaxID=1618424 RepID=A0A0G0WGL2_9BACT|nr:MAG: hypothetical protein UU26_C0009G0039 [Candidatus Daviesbacteria bacterium GW2011_GWC1_40_9]KKR83440.1 MAG: hypothetical protein UU29_C0005G0021 [Candidatus Daviesbacteria bacterium GW2011_GWA2_40_9]KKR93822.1 MAG: hypothetical protein UU44_C0001G0162 [Candidatus Daviesbacteria bacterium GW2011_GWB1_41_15]KKS15288.1 MAG: hypothetical protein UU73_C0002G0162 [Candidatus Daviesbacteria bacterium GW2011_GWA1_41_61]
MQTQRINITLPNDLARDLRKLIPTRSRSKFIASAIEEKLSKKDLKDLLRKSAEAQRQIIEEIRKDFARADEEAFSKLS